MIRSHHHAGSIPIAASVLLAGSLIAGAGGCQAMYAPLPVAQDVDLARYTGTWYEIARYPNFFERDCTGVTAEYTILDDGGIQVVNSCRKGSLDGAIEEITGRARVVDDVTHAKLKVSFFGPFEGDYWILELGDNYEYAVVGEPSRNFLWILSRAPTLDEATYDGILQRLPGLGYNPVRLERTLQPE